MREIRDWESFKEKMDHEIDDCNIDLSVQGYRVDEKQGYSSGIRNHSGIKGLDNNPIKCCDYFYLNNGKFFCVEFSNLSAQKRMWDANLASIDKKIFTKPEWNIVNLQNSHTTILYELKSKVTDTDFLLRSLYDDNQDTAITNLPADSLTKHFLVVWHLWENLDSIDTIKFFDRLQDKLRNEVFRLNTLIPHENIHILTLVQFKERYN